MSIKIIFGLGNSGPGYAGTRHNAGALLLRSLADACGAEFAKNKFCNAWISKLRVGQDIVALAFCEGYMNESGSGVKKALAFFKANPEEAAVIYDDISLEPGRVKLSCGGSSGGHNGVADIIEKIGNGFARIRVGIGAKPIKAMPLSDYVLGRLSQSDINAIKAFDIKTCVAILVSQGLASAQNFFNRKPGAADSKSNGGAGTGDAADDKSNGVDEAGGGGADSKSNGGAGIGDGADEMRGGGAGKTCG